MYARNNNNIGRRSYNNYPQTPSWFPPGWSNQPQHPSRQTQPHTSLETHPNNKSYVKTEEFQKHVTQLSEIQSEQKYLNEELSNVAESVRNLEKTLIDNENLVNMQNHLYQANMTIANMVQEMITKYFNQASNISEPVSQSTRNVSENSANILSEVQNTLECISLQSKDTYECSDQLNNLVTTDLDNYDKTSDITNTTSIPAEVDYYSGVSVYDSNDQEDSDSCEGNIVDDSNDQEDSDSCEGNIVDVTTTK